MIVVKTFFTVRSQIVPSFSDAKWIYILTQWFLQHLQSSINFHDVLIKHKYTSKLSLESLTLVGSVTIQAKQL